MTLRLRLVLWYGAICALSLFLVTSISYATHARGQYDDVDRSLITTTEHQAQMALSGDPRLMEAADGFPGYLRQFDVSGRLLSSFPIDDAVPIVNPLAVVAHPAGPAYPAIASLLPGTVTVRAAPGGAFGTMVASGGRWRVYVQPLRQSGLTTGYLEEVTALNSVDASVARLAQLLGLISAVSLLIELAGSCLVVNSALRTVDHLTDAASSIASSRDLSRRITTTGMRDEIGRLADTFNDMLGSLQQAILAQSRFVSDASHELRAPLTALQANLDLVSRHPDLPASDRAEALGEASREAVRLARLVSDLLSLARADAGVALQLERVELDELVLDAFATARKLANGQELILDPFEPVTVQGDGDRLLQMLLVLLDNALKYTPAHGRVTVGLRRAGEAQAEIRVCDTGVGIPSNALPHVFERFYRADPARSRDPGGTGLGLPIALWIVEQHGGSIVVESAVGGGTTFVVTVPILVAPPPRCVQ